MNTKLLLAGFAGAFTYFVVGFLLYGLLLADFFNAHMAMPGINRMSNEMDFLPLIVGNVCWGFLMAVILNMSNGMPFSKGILAGATIGFLMSAGFDGVMMGTTKAYTHTYVLADIVTFTVMSAIAGGVVAMTLSMGKKNAMA